MTRSFPQKNNRNAPEKLPLIVLTLRIFSSQGNFATTFGLASQNVTNIDELFLFLKASN